MEHLMRSIVGLIVLAAGIASLAGCGGGGGGGVTTDVGILTSDYQVLDLTTGTVESRQSLPDLLTNPAYKTTKMVFKAVYTGSGVVGALPGEFGFQADEGRTGVDVTKYYLATFEVTQKQWENLAGTTPWTSGQAVSVAGGAASVADGKPAFNLSYQAIKDVLDARNAAWTPTLALPTNSQWEYACRAGATSLYAWGDSHAPSVVSPFARTWETLASGTGPGLVGGRSANAFGLYDMHGNVWE
ncbi:MAG: formylglycine-generating enzyme family protein, partial [Nocardioidaceae bacterium]|nr:formylglycine-generating enzyme family protein [Nocardioidaceae bacterium]